MMTQGSGSSVESRLGSSQSQEKNGNMPFSPAGVQIPVCPPLISETVRHSGRRLDGRRPYGHIDRWPVTANRGEVVFHLRVHLDVPMAGEDAPVSGTLEGKGMARQGGNEEEVG